MGGSLIVNLFCVLSLTLMDNSEIDQLTQAVLAGLALQLAFSLFQNISSCHFNPMITICELINNFSRQTFSLEIFKLGGCYVVA